MPSSVPTYEDLTNHYTTAMDALYEIARGYLYLGRVADAQHLLRTTLYLREAQEMKPQACLKLLLLYGKVLIVDLHVHRGEADLMLSTALQAKQTAEAVGEQQGLADALSLLGQGRCSATTVAIVKSGGMPFGTQGQGAYEEALVYQQQALELREALQDTRGMSESHFGIGLVYQFWQQHELAWEHFTKAIQIAEKSGHILEQAEPHRHLTFDALFRGDLDQALIHARSALSFREAAGFRPYQPHDHLALWDIYRKRGDTANAQLHMRRASALAEEMGFATIVSSLVNAMSRLEDQEGQA